jgi:hypothetical protein
VAAADVGERLHLADLYEHCFPRVPAHRDSAPQKLASTLDAARISAPDHITEFVCEDCGDHVHVFGHYYGLPVHSTCPLHPRTSDMPEHIIKGHLRGDT